MRGSEPLVRLVVVLVLGVGGGIYGAEPLRKEAVRLRALSDCEPPLPPPGKAPTPPA